MNQPLSLDRPRSPAEMLASLADDGISSERLIADYLAFHGRFYFGLKLALVRRLRSILAREGRDDATRLEFHMILRPDDSRLEPAFLQEYAPAFADAYFQDGALPDHRRIPLVAPSPNQWYDPDFPSPWRHALGRPNRPGFDLVVVAPCAGLHAFVAATGYQLFDPGRNLAWSAASSRFMARSISAYPAVAVDRPVALVGDRFEASNYTHFLYDYVPRIAAIARTLPGVARKALFVVGEREGNGLQRFMLELICEAFGLRIEQFVFAERPEVWRLGDSVIFSSDQEVTPHPLILGDPGTVAAVRALLDPRRLPADTPRRLFVSRDDAGLRHMLNESEAMNILAPLGYRSVRMSEHDPATQMALLAQAERIVAPHGMGLANLVFNVRGARVLELFHPSLGTDAFALVSKVLGLDHALGIGAGVDDPRQHYNGPIGSVEAFAARP